MWILAGEILRIFSSRLVRADDLFQLDRGMACQAFSISNATRVEISLSEGTATTI
jgi:hypothetical protein